MSEYLRISKIFLARVPGLAMVLLALLAISNPAWSQADGSAKAERDAAKQAAKARKEEVKEAEKAIKKGNTEQLKAILQANPGLASASTPQSTFAAMAMAPLVGAPLAVAAGSGVTLLHKAASYNRKDAAELLLAYHANVNARDGLGLTPLHQAVMSLSTDVVRLLLDHGADVNTTCLNGDSPLKTLRWDKANRTRRQPLQSFIDIEQLLVQHGAQ